jgi:putative PIN family toxin of toxin-antitoxin system
MLRVFIDSSVFFAAIYSAKGYARDLLLAAVDEKLKVVVSQYVLTEVERNLNKKASEKIATYRAFLLLLDLERVPEPNQEQLKQVEQYVVEKDAPVVAAAINARPDYLVTFDVRDLLEPVEVAQQSGLKIVTPDVVMKLL